MKLGNKCIQVIISGFLYILKAEWKSEIHAVCVKVLQNQGRDRNMTYIKAIDRHQTQFLIIITLQLPLIFIKGKKGKAGTWPGIKKVARLWKGDLDTEKPFY